MPKNDFLSGLKQAIAPAPDWATKRARLVAAIEAADTEHGKAALDVQQQVSGATERLMKATQGRQAARVALDTHDAAHRAWEDQEQARLASAAHAEAARLDKAALAAFDDLAAHAAKGEAILRAYDAWWEGMIGLHHACQAQFTENPRVRQDLQHYSLADLVSREITRISSGTTLLPPGGNLLAAASSDRGEWQSLASYFAGLAKGILPQAAKGNAKAA